MYHRETEEEQWKMQEEDHKMQGDDTVGRGQRARARPSEPYVKERSRKNAGLKRRLDLETWRSQRPYQAFCWMESGRLQPVGAGGRVSGGKEMRQ